MLRSTHVADQINSQLNDFNDGLTIFAPTDDAFAQLKPGALNSMSDEQQVELMQFHVVPTLLSMTQFQTVSNPLMTKAGGNKPGEFPLNVTSNGDRVSLYTDSTEASVERTLFTDNRLAVYQVNKVLLAKRIFPKMAALAPTQPKQQEEPASEVTTSASNGLLSVKVYAQAVVAIGISIVAMVWS
ncbi:hypothetical protein CRG98_027637 [Punica granatum]|nr:hypothetical protein CRG98_027637 [Punica granatum]